MTSANQRVVLFDGVCVLCCASAHLLMRLDRRARFKLGTIQSLAGQQVLRQLGMSTDDPESFVLLEDSRAYTHSTACIRILWRLSLPMKVLGLLLWLVPRPLRDALYRTVARHRFHWFGRRDYCMVPSAAMGEHIWQPEVAQPSAEPAQRSRQGMV